MTSKQHQYQVNLDLDRCSHEAYEVLQVPSSSHLCEKLQGLYDGSILEDKIISILKHRKSDHFIGFIFATSPPESASTILKEASSTSLFLKVVFIEVVVLDLQLLLLSKHIEHVRLHSSASFIYFQVASDDTTNISLFKRAGFESFAVVDRKTLKIIEATVWKFNPHTHRANSIDDDKFIYFGLKLVGDEPYACPSDWNPGNMLLIKRGALKNQRTNDDTCIEKILVCTAPEPWAMVKDYFVKINDYSKGDCHVYMVTSMEEKKVIKDIDEFRGKGIVKVYGIGGGSACDFAKIASEMLDCTLYLVPSVLSVDAPFTRKAGVRVVNAGRTGVRYISDACRLKQLIIDAELLQQAPKVLNTGGVGDILSIITALWDWREAHTNQGEYYEVDVACISLGIVNKLLTACAHLQDSTDEGYKVLAECFLEEVLLCEQWGNSRPEEGSEHYLAYAIESLTGRGYIHGRLVGLCIIIVRLLQHVASNIADVTADQQNIMEVLQSCQVSKTLADVYNRIGLHVVPDSDGMPTRMEVVNALRNMDSFLKMETQLLPGYFHFYGAPSSELTEAVVAHTFKLLSH